MEVLELHDYAPPAPSQKFDQGHSELLKGFPAKQMVAKAITKMSANIPDTMVHMKQKKKNTAQDE